MPSFAGTCFLTLLLLEAESPPEAPFGFRGLEIFRASGESLGLRALDLNGDGRTDLVYADNSDATIRLLIQVTPGEPGKPAEAAPAGKRSLNDVPSDERFRTERFYTEKKVTSLEAADLDGDQKPDLVYYGDPNELEVVYQKGEWGSRREKVSIPDGSEGPEALAVTDLDGDGRAEVVLLGSGKTYVFRPGREAGGLGKPQVIYNAYADAAALLAGDLDADGRADLVLLRPRATHPFLLRFQRPSGFGPEIAVKSLPVHRAYLQRLGASGRADLLAIQGNTRRIRALRLGKPKESPVPALSEPRLYALRPDSDPALRRIQFGDVNGDGRTDLMVSSAETAELDVYLQDSHGELAAPLASPTLAEVKGIATGDLDGDGKPEVVVISAREKAVGVSRWLEAGRLSIPESFTLEGEPLLVATGRIEEKGSQLAIVEKQKDGKFQLSARAVRGGALVSLGERTFGAGAEPSHVSLFDANGDGLSDAMVFVPYEDPRLYLRESGGGGTHSFELREVSGEKDFGIGQISRLAPQAFALAYLEAPVPGGAAPATRPLAMLVAQKSYARALSLDGQGRLRVVEQFAGRGAAADIQGAAALNLDADPEKEVLLFDKSESTIQILDRSPQATYRQARSISMPGFEFAGFSIQDLNGDGREDAAVIGKLAVAVLYQGVEDGELEEIARYDLDEKSVETAGDRPLPDRLVVGDLNADGEPDIGFSSEPRNLLSFLSPSGAGGSGTLSSRLTFPIFEEKSYMRRQTSHGPREMAAADVDGDGKTDLILLIHDRILLYTQE